MDSTALGDKIGSVPPNPTDCAVKLVVFDLGRVLVRICDDWRHACRLAGVPAPPPADPTVLAMIHDLSIRCDLGQMEFDDFARQASTLMGLDVRQVQAASDAYLLGRYPGVSELVDELAAAGVQTACLSNTNANHWRIMSDPSHPSYLPLERLTHRFASHLVGARKPDPAIYAQVERASGIPAGQILFFDDVAENVDAARARGWRAHRIDPLPDDPIPQVREVLRRHGIA